MMTRALFRLKIFAGPFLLLALLLLGCGGGGSSGSSGSSGSGSTPVTVSVGGGGAASGLSAEAVPADVAQIKFTVSAADMATITNTVAVTGAEAEVTVTLDVPNGNQRVFTVEALDSANTILYSGSTTADLVGDPVELNIALSATTATVNGVLGDWGFGRLTRDIFGTWHAEGGTCALNSNGTESITSTANDGGAVVNISASLSYRVDQDPDGSLSVTETVAGESKSHTRRVFVSDDWSVMLMDGTGTLFDGQEITDALTLMPLIRLDKNRLYSSADVKGQYYFIGYDYNPTTPIAGVYTSFAGMMTASGLGNIAITSSTNGDGFVDFGYGEGVVSVSPNGSFKINGNGVGYIGGNGKLLVSSSADEGGRWSEAFFMKRGDKIYSTADIAGKWAFIGFGDSSGAVFHSAVGRMVCNAAGLCTGELKKQLSTGMRVTDTFELLVEIAPDGSFGSSLMGAPYYAGAIGNGGNTLIFNMSFVPDHPEDREVLLGVKCSGCSLQ